MRVAADGEDGRAERSYRRPLPGSSEQWAICPKFRIRRTVARHARRQSRRWEKTKDRFTSVSKTDKPKQAAARLA